MALRLEAVDQLPDVLHPQVLGLERAECREDVGLQSRPVQGDGRGLSGAEDPLLASQEVRDESLERERAVTELDLALLDADAELLVGVDGLGLRRDVAVNDAAHPTVDALLRLVDRLAARPSFAHPETRPLWSCPGRRGHGFVRRAMVLPASGASRSLCRRGGPLLRVPPR